jgi:hypothetical protein
MVRVDKVYVPILQVGVFRISNTRNGFANELASSRRLADLATMARRQSFSIVLPAYQP